MIPTAQIGPASKQCLPVRRGVILGQGFHLKVNRGSEKTGLDVRPHAGLQAADVGTKNTHGKQRAAMLVDDRRAPTEGPCSPPPVTATSPERACISKSWPGRSAAGPLAPKPEAGRVDNLRIARSDALISQTKLVHDARSIVLDQHVCAGDKPVCDLQSFLRLEIKRDASLVSVDSQRERADAIDERLSADQWRSKAPRNGSTLMTSAPRSAKYWAQAGPCK